MTHILELKNINKAFGGLHAVENCSYSVKKNSITGLIGPNGAGKTTTFDLISGLLEADNGAVYFKGENITDSPAHMRAIAGIGRTFQTIRLFPELTVLDNLLVVLENPYQKLRHAFIKPKKELKKIHDRALQYLKEVNLENYAHAYARNLSYGQQKLLEIIRAVATEANLLLLDEPAAGVNPTMLRHIENLIRRLRNEGRTIFIVEHNMPFIMKLCQEIIVMDQGRQLMIGTPQEVQKNEKVLEAYLGKIKSIL